MPLNTNTMRAIRLLLVTGLVAGCATLPPEGRTPYTPTPAMEAVLTEWQAMHPRPLPDVSPSRARDVPTLADAARAIPNTHGLPAPTTETPQVTDLVASGAEGPLSARLYRPALARDTPLIIYFPGGTWVTGTLDGYDESARQLSARTGWAVVSIRTRLAPEALFPAAHDDAYAAYLWARGTMRAWGADPTRVVLAGEGPGANLALSTALLARDRHVAIPDHLLLITPQLTTTLDSPSMSENRRSNPLDRRTVDWAQDTYTDTNQDLRDPRLDILPRLTRGAAETSQLPPTTIVLAEIDPLRSDGEALAATLTASAIPTAIRIFPGTTHDFFGLGKSIPEAASAEQYAADQMKIRLNRNEIPALRPAPPGNRRGSTHHRRSTFRHR